MIKRLLRKSKSNLGAMDKVLVSLLFVIIGVTAVIGFNYFTESHVDNFKEKTEDNINLIMDEIETSSGG